MYLPHEGSQFHDEDIFDNLAEYIINIRTGSETSTILVRDFNLRTGTLNHFIFIEATSSGWRYRPYWWS